MIYQMKYAEHDVNPRARLLVGQVGAFGMEWGVSPRRHSTIDAGEREDGTGGCATDRKA